MLCADGILFSEWAHKEIYIGLYSLYWDKVNLKIERIR